jgi:endo-1,4-beta-xylanase
MTNDQGPMTNQTTMPKRQSIKNRARWTLAAGIVILTLAAPVFAAENAADPLSAEATSARIQKHRTADVTLTVTGLDGRPLVNAAVTVEQVRHKFLFGCNAFGVKPQDTSETQKAYQDRFAALLNYATLPFYWGNYERQEGNPGADRVRAMAEWCRTRDIRTKGHPLCWHMVEPKWLSGRPLEEVEKLQLARITRDVTAFAAGDLIRTWDVVNEAVIMPDFEGGKGAIPRLCQKIGREEIIKRTFAAARAANPKAFLLLNDYELSPKYEALIKDSLAAGVTIDAVGIQSHMHGGYLGGRHFWDLCERFAKFGKPLHFTEATIISGDTKRKTDWKNRQDGWDSTPEGEERQGREAADFYRTLFSHPAVEAITWWDFSDAGAWLGAPSGLVRKDMSPKPAYEALMKMIKKEWWTGPTTLKTDAQGKVNFRGFLGVYAIKADRLAGTFDLAAPGLATVAAQLKLKQ